MILQLMIIIFQAGRTVDEVLHQHDLSLPHPDEELVTGRYIDVSVMLKIPALN